MELNQSNQLLNKFNNEFVKSSIDLAKINTIWIAVSGGVDSMVLLDLVVKNLNTFSLNRIKVIHINHNIHKDSFMWQKLVSAYCAKNKLALVSENVYLNKDSEHNKVTEKLSLEEHARELRYNKFSSHIKENDLLLLAHHLDDQAETVLFRLIKGAGIKGLSGINQYTKYKNFYKFCPLLNITKQEILDYAKYYNIKYCTDPSNNNTKFDRNFLRHEIFPLLKKRWPEVSKTIYRSSRLLDQGQKFINTQVQKYYIDSIGSRPNTLSIKKLINYSNYIRNEIIRFWLVENNFKSCSKKHLDILYKEVMQAKIDAQPLLKISNYEFRRYQDDLYLFESNITRKKNSKQIKIENTDIKKTKKMFQKEKIPPWERLF